jgi:hypothetical protein
MPTDQLSKLIMPKNQLMMGGNEEDEYQELTPLKKYKGAKGSKTAADGMKGKQAILGNDDDDEESPSSENEGKKIDLPPGNKFLWLLNLFFKGCSVFV